MSRVQKILACTVISDTIADHLGDNDVLLGQKVTQIVHIYLILLPN